MAFFTASPAYARQSSDSLKALYEDVLRTGFGRLDEMRVGVEKLKEQIEQELTDNKVIKIENRITADNPLVKFYLEDKDGDNHEVVFKIIQTPDR